MNIADRVKETTTVTSASVITLAGAVANFRRFSAALTVGDTEIPVSIDDGSGKWENGYYTLTNANTLTRTAIHSSSNAGAAVVFSAGVKEVFCTLSSTTLNAIIAQLRSEIPAASGIRDVAYSQTIPLSVTGQAYMPQTSVTGPITFVASSSPVRGSLVYLRLIADGTNLPNFAAFREWGGSLGYDNRAGIINQVQFFNDGVDSWVSISQAVGVAPAPVEATAVTLTGPTSGVVGTASSAFTVGTNTARIASLTVTPVPVSGVTFSPSSMTLAAGTATATFTATSTTAGAKSIAVTNSGGLTNPAAITFTVAASATAPSAPTIGTAVAGDGYIDVAFTVGSNGGSAITSNTATLSTGEFASGTSSPIRVTAANGTARTATVTSTNAIGPGPASAASNSVTPAAAATGTNVRLNRAILGATESASQPWTYTGTGTNGISGSTGAVSVVSLPDGVNGEAVFKVETLANDFMVQIGISPTVNGYIQNSCIWNNNGKYIPIRGAVKVPLVNIVPAAGDLLRLKLPSAATETNNNITCEFAVSKDNGATWTVIFTDVAGLKGVFYAKVGPAYTSVLSCVSTVGFV